MNDIIRDHLVSIEEEQARLVSTRWAMGNQQGRLQANRAQHQAQAAIQAVDGNAVETRRRQDGD